MTVARSTVDINKLSAVDLQQLYYEMVGDADWELYDKTQRKYLIQKIARVLIGPPTKEGNLKNDEENLQGYELRDFESVMKVYNKISERADFSHNGQNILISTIRVVCVIPRQKEPMFLPTPANYWVDLHTKPGNTVNLCVFHVFSIRRCISMKAGGQACRIYIDHDGRVYESWEKYLNNNKLPKCVMVVPADGVYKGKLRDDGQLVVVSDVVPSPALGPGAKVLSFTDSVATVASIGGLVAVVGAITLPATAPVAAPAAAVVGTVTGIYGIIRSVMELVDRKEHEQDIDLSSSEGRGYWITIFVSSIGLSLGAATSLLTWAAASGANIKILMNAVTILQYTNIGGSAIGVVNSLTEMIYKHDRYKETPSDAEIFQFTISVLSLGLGVLSNQTAQEIVKDAQITSLDKISDRLPSNNKRRMLDKVCAETRRLKGTIEGNADVIKGLNNINNKEDFFAKIKAMNKDMNRNNVRISLSPDGNVVLNNQIKVDLSEFYKLGKPARNQLFSGYGPADTATKNAPIRQYPSITPFKEKISEICDVVDNIDNVITQPCNDSDGFNSNVHESNDIPSVRRINPKEFMSLRAGEILNVGAHKIIVKAATIDNLEEWIKMFAQIDCEEFMELCFEIISLLNANEVDHLNLLNPDEDVIFRVSNYLLYKAPIGFLAKSSDRAVNLKRELLKWRSTQKVRKHYKCLTCRGIRFY